VKIIIRALTILASGNLVAFLQNVILRKKSKKERLLPRPLDKERGVAGVINKAFDALPQRNSYLEVGIFKGATFQNVIAGEKWGVDIEPSFDFSRLPKNTRVFVQPSDTFFAQLAVDKKFDMVYIDAQHTFDQAYRELVHSFNHLEKWGVILLDDTVPENSIASIPSEAESKEASLRLHGTTVWSHQGDVWKVIMQVREKHKNIAVRTIVGPSRPRTFMWVNEQLNSNMILESAEHLSALTYDEAFQFGIPKQFDVRDFGDVLVEIKNRRFD
jgi:hypothetical protein